MTGAVTTLPILGAADLTELRATDDRRYITVEVPEWRRSVRLREMSAGERVEYEAFRATEPAPTAEACAAWMIACTAIDANGQRAFTDADREWLATKNEVVLFDLMTRMVDLNVLTLELIEARRKNLPSVQSAVSH